MHKIIKNNKNKISKCIFIMASYCTTTDLDILKKCLMYYSLNHFICAVNQPMKPSFLKGMQK